MKDTKALQVTSLEQFMYKLGYRKFKGHSFIGCEHSGARPRIRYEIAIRLHNGTYMDFNKEVLWHLGKYRPRMARSLGIPLNTIREAYESR